MFKVFNSHALSSKQRFLKALLYGVPTAIGLGIAYGIILRIIPIAFSLVYVGIGYLIGVVIRKYGRGVQPKFSILAAALSVFSFLLSETVRMVGLNFSLNVLWLMFFILPQRYLGSINGLINLAFVVYGAYIAYRMARIV
jgi:hypothetical protein